MNCAAALPSTSSHITQLLNNQSADLEFLVPVVDIAVDLQRLRCDLQRVPDQRGPCQSRSPEPCQVPAYFSYPLACASLQGTWMWAGCGLWTPLPPSMSFASVSSLASALSSTLSVCLSVRLSQCQPWTEGGAFHLISSNLMLTKRAAPHRTVSLPIDATHAPTPRRLQSTAPFPNPKAAKTQGLGPELERSGLTATLEPTS